MSGGVGAVWCEDKVGAAGGQGREQYRFGAQCSCGVLQVTRVEGTRMRDGGAVRGVRTLCRWVYHFLQVSCRRQGSGLRGIPGATAT